MSDSQNDAEMEMKRIREEMERMRQERDSYKSQVGDLTQKVSTLEDRNLQLEERNEELVKEVAKTKEELIVLRTQVADKLNTHTNAVELAKIGGPDMLQALWDNTDVALNCFLERNMGAFLDLSILIFESLKKLARFCGNPVETILKKLASYIVRALHWMQSETAPAYQQAWVAASAPTLEAVMNNCSPVVRTAVETATRLLKLFCSTLLALGITYVVIHGVRYMVEEANITITTEVDGVTFKMGDKRAELFIKEWAKEEA